MSKPTVLELPTMSMQTLVITSLSLAILIIAVIVLVARSKAKSKGNVVLLLGDEDAGKTAVLTTLIYDQALPTHTSLQINKCSLPPTPSQKQLHVVDIPGHPRLRDSFKNYIQDTKAVVFIVDVSTITRNGSEIAEHLHHVLHAMTSLPATRSLPPLAILAHKSDLLPSTSSLSQDRSALAISRVRTVLERELEKRRVAQAGGVGVEGLGAEGEGTELGGLECRTGTFKFAEWEGGEVHFLSSWVKIGNTTNEKHNREKSNEDADGLDDFRLWLDDLP